MSVAGKKNKQQIVEGKTCKSIDSQVVLRLLAPGGGPLLPPNKPFYPPIEQFSSPSISSSSHVKERPAIDSKIWVWSEPPRVVASISRFFTRLFRRVLPEKSFFLPAGFSRVGVADVGSHEEIESSKRILSSLSISKPGESGDDLL